MKFDILSGRYKGKTAKAYDSARESGEKWRNEQYVVRQLLQCLPGGSRIIDIPVGTGRFIEVYKDYGLQATGVDISADMLAETSRKLAEKEFDMDLIVGDIRRVNAKDGAFDCAVCIRFLNWINTRDVVDVLCELSRISGRHLVVGVRQYVPLMELLPVYGPRNSLRLIGQLYRRLGRRRGLIFHGQETIQRIFRDLRLTVVKAKCIEQRRDGTDYYIYLLAKDLPSKK